MRNTLLSTSGIQPTKVWFNFYRVKNYVLQIDNAIFMKSIIETALKNSMSFEEYMTLMSALTLEGKTTGPKQTEDLAHYTKLNNQRMKRLIKTSKAPQEIIEVFDKLNNTQTWLIILESWCGDAAQVVPLIQKVADESELIETRFVLRDENPELMDRFLTRGGRSIPKLIILDSSNNVLGSWGPRPIEAQELYDTWHNSEVKVPYQIFSETLQKWYTEDRGESTFKELVELVNDIVENGEVAVV